MESRKDPDIVPTTPRESPEQPPNLAFQRRVPPSDSPFPLRDIPTPIEPPPDPFAFDVRALLFAVGIIAAMLLVGLIVYLIQQF
jgi:hypothetical protein